MHDLIFADKFVQNSIKSIIRRDIPVQVGMALEKEKKKLNFCLDIWGNMNYSVYVFNFLLNYPFRFFGSPSHKRKYPVKTFY